MPFFLCAITGSFFSFCIGVQGADVSPDCAWIKQEKIRAGYLYYYDDVRYARSLQEAGMNTVLVKGWQFADRKQTENTLLSYKKWALSCRRNGLHLFAAYNWQPQETVFQRYRPVVFADGREGLFVCPLDRMFWQEHLILHGMEIARLSLDPNGSIDGILLDLEMYRTEKEHAERKNYSPNACFCDFCFSTFLFAKGYTGFTLPPVDKRDRSQWLAQKGWLDQYRRYLEQQVSVLAHEYSRQVRLVNPRLLLAVYPHPSESNWVLRDLAKEFGTPEVPVVIFATHSYYVGGYQSIPSNQQQYLEGMGIDAVYVAGYLFRKYSSGQIEENLLESARRADGYWLFKMPQLWKQDLVGKNEQLAGGSQADYWKAIRSANQKIQQQQTAKQTER